MRHRYAAALLIAAAFTMTPVLADPPPWAGGGKGNSDRGKGNSDRGKGNDDRGRGNNDRDDRGARGDDRSSRDSERRQPSRDVYFADQHRVHVREYYDQHYQRGHCPPGLAKKRNGCMPPGQAKKWNVGRPLPRDVVYYSVPPELVVRLGEPRAGHRYVRVAADILLIAVGSGMVVDAIQDLGRM